MSFNRHFVASFDWHLWVVSRRFQLAGRLVVCFRQFVDIHIRFHSTFVTSFYRRFITSFLSTIYRVIFVDVHLRLLLTCSNVILSTFYHVYRRFVTSFYRRLLTSFYRRLFTSFVVVWFDWWCDLSSAGMFDSIVECRHNEESPCWPFNNGSYRIQQLRPLPKCPNSGVDL